MHAATLQLQVRKGVQVTGEHALNHMVEAPSLPVLGEGLMLGLPGIEPAAMEVSEVEGRPGYSRECGGVMYPKLCFPHITLHLGSMLSKH